jgi:hypothetical protein
MKQQRGRVGSVRYEVCFIAEQFLQLLAKLLIESIFGFRRFNAL